MRQKRSDHELKMKETEIRRQRMCNPEVRKKKLN